MARQLDIMHETDEKANSGRNTERMIYPGKDPLSIVPTVDFIGDDGIMVYNKWTLYFDKDSVNAWNEAEKARVGEENFKPLRQIFSFAQLHDSDEAIDVGLWMQNHREEAFSNLVVKSSTEYKREPNYPLDHSTEYLIPCLWINNPNIREKDGTLKSATEEHILKFTQKTIAKGLRAIYDGSPTGKVRGLTLQIAKISSTQYNISSYGMYAEELPPREINVNDYTDIDNREQIVEILARYGINVPAAPEGTVRMPEGYYLSKSEYEALNS